MYLHITLAHDALFARSVSALLILSLFTVA